jgi:hypothetical protein
MGSHTPGPWSTVDMDGEIDIVGADARGVVATVRDGNQKRTVANAHLIAAAPAMSAALLDILESHLAADCFYSDERQPCACKRMAPVRAALRLAGVIQ